MLLDAVGRPRWTGPWCPAGGVRGQGGRFRPPKWYTLHKLNNRMHRKILVIDGQVAFPARVGIADEWAGDGEDPKATGATLTSGSRAGRP